MTWPSLRITVREGSITCRPHSPPPDLICFSPIYVLHSEHTGLLVGPDWQREPGRARCDLRAFARSLSCCPLVFHTARFLTHFRSWPTPLPLSAKSTVTFLFKVAWLPASYHPSPALLGIYSVPGVVICVLCALAPSARGKSLEGETSVGIVHGCPRRPRRTRHVGHICLVPAVCMRHAGLDTGYGGEHDRSGSFLEELRAALGQIRLAQSWRTSFVLDAKGMRSVEVPGWAEISQGPAPGQQGAGLSLGGRALGRGKPPLPPSLGQPGSASPCGRGPPGPCPLASLAGQPPAGPTGIQATPRSE